MGREGGAFCTLLLRLLTNLSVEERSLVETCFSRRLSKSRWEDRNSSIRRPKALKGGGVRAARHRAVPQDANGFTQHRKSPGGPLHAWVPGRSPGPAWPRPEGFCPSSPSLRTACEPRPPSPAGRPGAGRCTSSPPRSNGCVQHIGHCVYICR